MGRSDQPDGVNPIRTLARAMKVPLTPRPVPDAHRCADLRVNQVEEIQALGQAKASARFAPGLGGYPPGRKRAGKGSDGPIGDAWQTDTLGPARGCREWVVLAPPQPVARWYADESYR